MGERWSTDDLKAIGSAQELEIAVRRSDGGLGRWTPIWVVCAGGEVFVRTWHRRETGWYGGVLRTGRARVRAGGLVTDVLVEDVGETARSEVDAAYRGKYTGGVADMVSDSAALSTLRLRPAS
ncbi:hypothetical protein Aab01nite_78170 [Paractinoplanes abujensis]|uniref:DUF2255 family protein n=1 Tax=Paractinoplanes abujensis TaxID=882441 RepID=A0A7W7CPE3_9ACTN|nr:DUF2255 family protein [Actinoplanes abujensis]MBB4692294.1 hypothetical protein [Actinoplanes abujensis]GID24227.1 hypothetical protein Aab01nite_78170 [Actinoplanes abujensis]